MIRHLTPFGDVPAAPSPRRATWRHRGLALPLTLSLLALMGGCRSGEMYDQPRYEPYQETSFFANRSSARATVAGTVPRLEEESTPEGRVFRTGRSPDNTFVDSLPADAQGKKSLTEVLLRGKDRFGIYCTPCHGVDGGGRGQIVLRGFVQPPKLYEEKVVKQPLGYYFDVITNGHGAMYSYSARIPDPADRWAIAGYLRALQLSHNVSAEMVPTLPRADRDELQKASTTQAVPAELNGKHTGEVVK